MEFGKRHDTTDTTDFSRANLLRTCCGLATGKLRDNWCNVHSYHALFEAMFTWMHYLPPWALRHWLLCIEIYNGISRFLCDSTAFLFYTNPQQSEVMELGIKHVQEAQLPQRAARQLRTSFSARSMIVHFTEQLYNRLAKLVSTQSISYQTVRHCGRWSFQTLYNFKVVCLSIIRKRHLLRYLRDDAA